jgi:hypothetical protein
MKQNRLIYKNLIAFLIIIALISSCSSFSKYAYGTLGTAAVTYDSSMKAFADMYKKGYISDADKALAIEVAGKYYEIYQTAVVALEMYNQLEGAAKEIKKLEIEQLLISLLDMGERVTALVNEFQTKKIEGK